MHTSTEPGSPAAVSAAAELEDTRHLLGVPRVVKLNSGSTVHVRGFTFGQLFAVLAAAQPIFDAIASRPAEPVMQVIGEHRAAVAQLVSLSTGLELAAIDALPALDGITLARAVYDENAVFFRQELMPMFLMAFSSQLAKSSSSSTTAAAESAPGTRIEAAPSPDGHGLPINSSAAATDGATSTA